MGNSIYKKRGSFLILSMILILISCQKKELPQTEFDTPVFYFSGEIGGEKIEYKAGVNGMYMYTNYFKDVQDIFTLKGTLAQQECQTCSPYLSFELKDIIPSNHLSLANGIQFFFRDSVFTSYSMDSVLQPKLVEKFKFSTVQSSTGTAYQWNFGDGFTSTSASPEHTYTTEGVKYVTLATLHQGVTDSMTIPIDVSPVSTCRTQFSFVYNPATNKVVVTADNFSFASYAWDFGNGAFGSGIVDSVTYNLPGIYTVKLTATINGCTSEFTQKIDATNSPFSTLANFVYSTSQSYQYMLQERLNTKVCIITYHKDGKVYKSFKNIKGLVQNTNPILTITGVENYRRNELDMATMSISGETDTYLYNQNNSSDSIPIKSNKLRIAVAYPD